MSGAEAATVLTLYQSTREGASERRQVYAGSVFGPAGRRSLGRKREPGLERGHQG